MCVKEGAAFPTCAYTLDAEQMAAVFTLHLERSKYFSGDNDAGMLDTMSPSVTLGA
jgi:hypothetical protein